MRPGRRRSPHPSAREHALRRAPAAIAVVALATGAAISACGGTGGDAIPADASGAPDAGADAIRSLGCGSCHAIPGIRGADAHVGPPLDAWAQRSYVAGALENTPRNVERWVLDPQDVEPGTVMPDVGATEQQAADIAAYLFTLGD
jgi:cytochrome c